MTRLTALPSVLPSVHGLARPSVRPSSSASARRVNGGSSRDSLNSVAKCPRPRPSVRPPCRRRRSDLPVPLPPRLSDFEFFQRALRQGCPAHHPRRGRRAPAAAVPRPPCPGRSDLAVFFVFFFCHLASRTLRQGCPAHHPRPPRPCGLSRFLVATRLVTVTPAVYPPPVRPSTVPRPFGLCRFFATSPLGL